MTFDELRYFSVVLRRPSTLFLLHKILKILIFPPFSSRLSLVALKLHLSLPASSMAPVGQIVGMDRIKLGPEVGRRLKMKIISKIRWPILLLLSLILSVKTWAASYSDGCYEIQIGIDPEIVIPEALDGNFHSRTEELIRRSSAFLHQSLRDQAQLCRVTILVPETWDDQDFYEPAEDESYDSADLKLGLDFSCGACATSMDITMNYEHLNPPTFVHEFGHFRYGLGDEYVLTTSRSEIYRVNVPGSGMEWIRCTELQDATATCEENPVGASYDDRCAISSEPNGATGCLMFDNQHESQVTQFCDNGNDPATRHHQDVDSDHNRIWNGRSCWEAINLHPDFVFSGGALYTMGQPEIVWKKPDRPKTMLVMDVSGSMAQNGRLGAAVQSARNYIERVEEGSSVGIVAFDDISELLLGLTPITDTASRNTVKAAIPNFTDGATSIGAGIQRALAEFDCNTEEWKQMIVLTDGEENTAPFIADVLDSVQQCGIVVQSIGLAASSSSTIQNVARTTGGTYYYAPDDSPQALSDAFTTLANRTAVRPGQTLVSEQKMVTPGSLDAAEFIVDPTIGSDTVITLSGDVLQMANLEVSLVQPDGTMLDDSYPGFQADPVGGVVLFRITGIAQAGKWRLEVTNNDAVPARLVAEATSRALQGKVAIGLVPSLSSTTVQFPEPVKITAKLAAREAIVRGHVYALVTAPSGGLTTVNLVDNGQGGDTFRGDGVYSGHFTQFSENGRYAVRVYADNEEGTARVGAEFNDLSILGVSSPLEAEPLDFDFRRVISAGAFEVSGYQQGDFFRPDRIITLNVVERTDATVTLEWTASGDDFGNGTASAYDLRLAESAIHTEEEFTSASSVGDLPLPKQANEKEEFVVTGLSPETAYYFRLRVIDEANNISSLSNLVQTTTLKTGGAISKPKSESFAGGGCSLNPY